MHPGSSEKADFMVYSTGIRGTGRLCVDISVTHPCSTHTVNLAAVTPGAAAMKREVEKDAKHGNAARAFGYVFCPWVFESFGRWGDQVTADMADLEMCLEDPVGFRSDMRRTVALAIQRGNADMLAHAAQATDHLQSPGQVFTPSCRLSSAEAQLKRAGMRGGGSGGVSCWTPALLLDLLEGA